MYWLRSGGMNPHPTPRARKNTAVFFRRLFFAAFVYFAILGFFAFLHDYPQLRSHIQKIREHDAVVEKRQWLTLFYFVNEAGSGLKFFATADEKYMEHFPSPSHLFAARKARALKGDWQAQIAVARAYWSGYGVAQNWRESRYWLSQAEDSAANAQQRQQTEEIISYVESYQPSVQQ